MSPPTGGSEYSYDFGNVALGKKQELVVRLLNRGNAAMNAGQITLAAPFSSDFPAGGVVVQTGETLEVRFAFQPTEEGVQQAAAVIDYNNDRQLILNLVGTGVKPAFECSPSALDFGRVEQGRRKLLSVQCHNPTDLPLPLKVGPVTGDHQSFVATVPGIDAQGRVMVPAGKTLTFATELRADVIGRATASLPLADDSGNIFDVLPMTAEIVQSTLDLPTECVNFGFVPPGVAKEFPVVLRNSGSDPLKVTGLSLAGDSTFQMRTRLPTGGLVIPPDDPSTPEFENELPIIIELKPTDVGETGANLTIENTSNSNPATICLKGFGGGPIISCSPSSVDFGPTAVGIPGKRNVICQNLGTDVAGRTDDNLVIESINTPDGFSAEIINNDGSTGSKFGGYEANGESFRLQLTYDPAQEGIDHGQIEIASNDGLNPVYRIDVLGDARELEPCDFEIIPSTVRFGIVAPGSRASLEFGVRNNHATNACIISNLRLSDDTDTVFSIPDMPYIDLPPDSDIRVRVTFAPPPGHASTTPTIHTGRVLFDISNKDDMHQEVALRGSSQQPCAEITPAYLDFGTVKPNCATRDRFLNVRNICPDPIEITDVQVGAGFSEEFAISEMPILNSPIANGDAGEFMMRYMPIDEGEDIGSVLIYIKGSDEPYMATLRGKGEHNAIETERFSQESRPKVDVLWVLDNSGSMRDPFQYLLRDNVGAFLSFALAQGIDFQIAVTTTAVTDGRSSSCPRGGGFENGRLFPPDMSMERILTPYTKDLEEKYKVLMVVGDCHWDEQGLIASQRALSEPLISTPLNQGGNQGFLRRDAFLSVIYLSDEVDQSPGSAQTYSTFLKQLKGPRNEHMVRAHAIVGEKTIGCQVPGSSRRAEEGSRYLVPVEETGGIFQSICAVDWEEGLQRMSVGAFGFKTRFTLLNYPEDTNRDGKITDTIPPDGGRPEIEVRVNGRTIAMRTQRGTPVWDYDAHSNSIDFYPLYVPEPNSEIEVIYKVACLAQN